MLRRWWGSYGAGLRAILTLVVLVVLCTRLHPRSLLPAGGGATAVRLLVVAFGLTVGGFGLSVLRWHRVLAAMGMPTPVRTLARLAMVGLFISSFLPSTVGGDLVRARRLGTICRERAGALASVALERLTGWIVLPLLTLVALGANPSLLSLGSSAHLALAVALVTLAALAVVLVLMGNQRVGRALSERRNSLGRFVSALKLGLGCLRKRPSAAAGVLAVSVAYQLVVALSAFVAARSMGLALSWTAILAFMPAIAIVQVLPLTIGGLGLREGAFVVFLHPLGIDASHAIAFGLLVYALNLILSLMAAPVFAVDGVVGRRRAQAAPSSL